MGSIESALAREDTKHILEKEKKKKKEKREPTSTSSLSRILKKQPTPSNSNLYINQTPHRKKSLKVLWRKLSAGNTFKNKIKSFLNLYDSLCGLIPFKIFTFFSLDQ